jgi:DNA-binding NarL/FixJ family response regulator
MTSGTGSWADAYAAFSTADRDGSLAASDLEAFAVAAYAVGDDAGCLRSWERAHRAWLAENEPLRAARCAFWAGFGLFYKGQMAQSQGWFGRAQRLVDAHGPESVERGLLAVPFARMALDEDAERAYKEFHLAERIGAREGDLDLMAFGLLGQGQALIRLGRIAEGTQLLDQAMVSVATGEVSLIPAGTIYCAVVLECQLLFDVVRAMEWTAALARWCTSEMVPYRGQCLVHQSEMLQLRGDWGAAVEQADRACELLGRPPIQPSVGMAHYQRAELHRLRGEYDSATQEYREANRWGCGPHPGLALLRLAQGSVDIAEAAIRRALGDAPDALRRVPMLTAFFEIVLTAGDLDAAREAVDELCAVATERNLPVLRARAAHASGALLLAEGDPLGALEQLEVAAAAWHEVDATYDLARARVLIATCCRMVGDEDTAQLELEAARRTFLELGASPDLDMLTKDFAREATESQGSLSAREREVLSAVASGQNNRQVSQRLMISEKTVERHLSNIYVKLGVKNRTAATGYAYKHGLM